MRVIIKSGDVLDEAVDVLICTANPLLRMSGGVNGAILQRGGSQVQEELRRHLTELGRVALDAGSIVRTGPGPLAVRHILHAVGVNVFYESSVPMIAGLLHAALTQAASLGAATVATPALATGYGPLTIEQFAAALREVAGREYPPVRELRVVLRRDEQAEVVRSVLGIR